MRAVLVTGFGLLVAAGLVAEAQGRPKDAADVWRLGTPAVLAVWAAAYVYGRVLARRLAADAERTIALSSRPEHTRERVLAVLRKR